MKLEERQLQTIEDLKNYEGITEPIQIIEWCKKKITLPRRTSSRPNAKSHIGRRERGKAYYQGIIDFLDSH